MTVYCCVWGGPLLVTVIVAVAGVMVSEVGPVFAAVPAAPPVPRPPSIVVVPPVPVVGGGRRWLEPAADRGRSRDRHERHTKSIPEEFVAHLGASHFYAYGKYYSRRRPGGSVSRRACV